MHPVTTSKTPSSDIPTPTIPVATKATSSWGIAASQEQPTHNLSHITAPILHSDPQAPSNPQEKLNLADRKWVQIPSQDQVASENINTSESQSCGQKIKEKFWNVIDKIVAIWNKIKTFFDSSNSKVEEKPAISVEHPVDKLPSAANHQSATAQPPPNIHQDADVQSKKDNTEPNVSNEQPVTFEKPVSDADFNKLYKEFLDEGMKSFAANANQYRAKYGAANYDLEKDAERIKMHPKFKDEHDAQHFKNYIKKQFNLDDQTINIQLERLINEGVLFKGYENCNRMKDFQLLEKPESNDPQEMQFWQTCNDLISALNESFEKFKNIDENYANSLKKTAQNIQYKFLTAKYKQEVLDNAANGNLLNHLFGGVDGSILAVHFDEAKADTPESRVEYAQDKFNSLVYLMINGYEMAKQHGKLEMFMKALNTTGCLEEHVASLATFSANMISNSLPDFETNKTKQLNLGKAIMFFTNKETDKLKKQYAAKHNINPNQFEQFLIENPDIQESFRKDLALRCTDRAFKKFMQDLNTRTDLYKISFSDGMMDDQYIDEQIKNMVEDFILDAAPPS